MLLSKKLKFFIYSFIVFIMGYFIYFHNYYKPNYEFWDENYDVAYAYKYLNNIFFLHSHPPVGKFFIALGEKIFHPNENIDTKEFLKVEKIKKFPKGFNFKGVRFFPALFAWFNAVLFFWLLYFLTDKLFLSFFGSFFYLFDNALIVHFRGAMLESTQFFFMFIALIFFVKMYKKEKRTIIDYVLFSIFFSLTFLTKLNGLILLLLYLPLFYKDLKDNLIIKLISSFFTVVITIIIVFSLHFKIANKIYIKTYHLNKTDLELVKEHKLPLYKGIIDYIQYIKIYERGVPKLKECNPKENGSLAITWPIMDKTILYRWHKFPDKTKYLYLVGNPILWLLGFIGIILSISHVIAKFVYDLKVKKSFEFIFIFAILYISYMIEMLRIERVMYLYHYFIPLVFSYILFVLQINYIFEKELIKKDKVVYLSLILLMILIIFVWWWFSPFTYYKPLTYSEFMNRNWFEFWHLKGLY